MVKLDDIPEEEPRIELATLADFMDANGLEVPFIALGEKEQEPTEEKTGGINIELWTGFNYASMFDIDSKEPVPEGADAIVYPDGLRLTQKYSKISGRHLKEAFERMKIKDTVELQKAFYDYRLRPMRSGYPRLIPVSKSDKAVESPTVE